MTDHPVPTPCECDYCPCHDAAEKWYEQAELADGADEQGGWLCWNCAIGQHHTCDFFWCPPEHYAHWHSL